MTNLKNYTKEWLSLAKSGNHGDAESFYFDKLLPIVSGEFKDKFEYKLKNDSILISILGYSPEPLILTAKAMSPQRHIICTTEHNKSVVNHLNDYLAEDYELMFFENDDFISIYTKLKEILIINNISNVVIDITGGKKSMVAAAAIFGKDYRCKIVYVDFESYISELRKPMPGSEFLNIVYDPSRDQPEVFIED